MPSAQVLPSWVSSPDGRAASISYAAPSRRACRTRARSQLEIQLAQRVGVRAGVSVADVFQPDPVGHPDRRREVMAVRGRDLVGVVLQPAEAVDRAEHPAEDLKSSDEDGGDLLQ